MKFRKTMIYSLLGLYLILVAISVWTDTSYFSKLPRTPDEKTGRIYRMVVSHGSVRYSSNRELENLKTIDGLQVPSALLFLLTLLWGLKTGALHVRGTVRATERN